MYIIVSASIDKQALRTLEQYGEPLLFKGSNTVYPAISKHPDIFLCYTGQQLIIAPELYESFCNTFSNLPVEMVQGYSRNEAEYPQTAHYNAVCTATHIIHNLKYSDGAIKNACATKKSLHVTQGYTRCNLLPLSSNAFITSDKGIEVALYKNDMKVLYVNPANIRLSGFKHGFFGGCCGIADNNLLLNGSLNSFEEKKAIEEFAGLHDFNIIELANRPAEDVGSMLCITGRRE